jgi:uncharacterized short protein YbdD (DUF466 family)
MKPYEQFRKEWMDKAAEVDKNKGPDEFVAWPSLLEFFCECDYKRYTGEWESNTL